MERAELKRLLVAQESAHAQGEFIFLVDPSAPALEKAKLESLFEVAARTDASTGWLCVPTGGTSGRARFARHDEATLSAAVSGFCVHFGVSRFNTLGVLPLHHVSGLMARLRAATTGGDYVHCDWKALSAGNWPTLPPRPEGWFLSLVPTQLQRLLELASGRDFLRSFRLIFIGGGPAWPKLLDAAAEAKLPLSFSYGMTETAAMIAAQKEGAFLRGERDAGAIMPHARVRILDESKADGSADKSGQIQIEGESVFRGYFPELRLERIFSPEDNGEWTGQGTLKILGRRDGMIITGGEKVWPSEVEAALRETGCFSDVVVLGIPDTQWGQAVTAFYPAADDAGLEVIQAPRSVEAVGTLLAPILAGYKLPKRIVAVEAWPRNEQGKVNRAALAKLLEST